MRHSSTFIQTDGSYEKKRFDRSSIQNTMIKGTKVDIYMRYISIYIELWIQK